MVPPRDKSERCENSTGDVDGSLEWTSSQLEVIAHRTGPFQVIACAGSGKTTTISRMAAEMVRDGVNRDSIVAFTFTNNAANQLKISIKKELERTTGNSVLGDMFVGTIHKFCQRLLNDYLPETLSYEVLSESALAAFIFQHKFKIGIHTLPPRHPNTMSKKVGWFIDDANTVRRENLENLLSSATQPVTQQFYQAYINFRSLLKEYHFFDFEELIYRATQLLEKEPDILSDVRKRFKHIIVDEYQDIDAAQERLIRLLVGPSNNIVVVGDDDQSIYKWRGAQVENFRSFSERYGGTPQRLEGNFRSTDLVIDLSRNFIRANIARLEKNMEPGRRRQEVIGEFGDVYQLQLDDQNSETDFIFRKINELVGTVYTDTKGRQKTLSYGDIAILFRKKKSARALVREFERRNFRDFFVSGEESIFANNESDLIRLAFAYIAGGQNDSITITDFEGENDKHRNPPQFVVQEADLRSLIRRSTLIGDREETIIRGLNELRHWYADPTSRRIFPQKDYQNILGLMGIQEKEFPERLMYNLGQISTLLKDFETVYRLIFPDQILDLVNYLDWAAVHVHSKVEDPTMFNAVNIMTIHSAKGMEFPVVFMPSLTKNEFRDGPSVNLGYSRPIYSRWLAGTFNYSSLEENAEDARRLFYVAMTRSRKYLFLSSARRAVGGGNTRNPSVFFEEIKQQEDYRVVTDPVPDPTPREYRQIDGGASGYIYETSFTQLRYMYNCPYDFKLKQIYGFCPTIDSSFNYGFAVHNILRRIHQDYLDAYSFPPRLPNREEIAELIENRDLFHLRYAQGEVEANLRNAAKKILGNYVEEYGKTAMMIYKPEVPFEYVIPIEDSDADVLLTGSIDLLERADPKTNRVVEVNVIDFKTEHLNDDDYDPRYRDSMFQVRLYALATQSQLPVTTRAGYIHYLSEGVRREVVVNDIVLHQIREDVKSKVRKIMSRNFTPVCNPVICNKCDRRNLCRHSAA